MSQFPPPIPTGHPTPNPLQYATPVSNQPMLNLRLIAQRQRTLMFCILFYIIALLLQFIIPGNAKMVASAVGLAAIVTAAVFLFMLAITLYGTGTGVVLGILTLIPCVGLIILLVVNNNATNTLSRHGIKVGLMGANLRQFPPPGSPGY